MLLVCSEARGVGVLAVVGAVWIGLGEGDREISGRIGWRKGAKLGGGIGKGRDNGSLIKAGITK